MVTRLRETATGVVVETERRAVALSWIWLRDHARDPSSFLASAHQRIVTPGDVTSAGVGTAGLDAAGTMLRVAWPGGPTALFDIEWLLSLVDADAASQPGQRCEAWTAHDVRERIRTLTFDEVVESDDGRRAMIDELWCNGLALLADVPLDHRSTRAVLERIGYVRATIFGELWEFRSDGGFDDTASTPMEISPHTDGTYSHDAPGLLGLHCHLYEAEGGENIFVDSRTVADRLSAGAHALLSTVEIPGQYIGDGSHLIAKRPVLRYDGERLVQASYNHHDRAPFVLPEPEMTDVYAALFEFDALANDPDVQFDLALRPGDMVIVDNWRLLHGRRAFSGERLIAGGYVNREDFESTTRLIA